MPARAFRGSDGTAWQVWSVIPGRHEGDERRCGYDRRSPEPVLAYPGRERRTAEDRRARPVLLAPGLQAGWLVFEREGTRRRLAPIPPGWERMSDAMLERLAERAVERA